MPKPTTPTTELSIQHNNLVKAQTSPEQPRQTKPQEWILDETWRLMQDRANGAHRQASPKEMDWLKAAACAGLQWDYKERAWLAGVQIEGLLDAQQLNKAWRKAKSWYRECSGSSLCFNH